MLKGCTMIFIHTNKIIKISEYPSAGREQCSTLNRRPREWMMVARCDKRRVIFFTIIYFLHLKFEK